MADDRKIMMTRLEGGEYFKRREKIKKGGIYHETFLE